VHVSGRPAAEALAVVADDSIVLPLTCAAIVKSLPVHLPHSVQKLSVPVLDAQLVPVRPTGRASESSLNSADSVVPLLLIVLSLEETCCWLAAHKDVLSCQPQ
jgi:hypothetical protein